MSLDNDVLASLNKANADLDDMLLSLSRIRKNARKIIKTINETTEEALEYKPSPREDDAEPEPAWNDPMWGGDLAWEWTWED